MGDERGRERSPAETNWAVNNEANCGVVVAALGNDVPFGGLNLISSTVFHRSVGG